MNAAEAALHEAIIDLCWKATPTGSTRDGDVNAYILPKGAVHRLVGAAQCAGIPASLRAEGAPTSREEALRLAFPPDALADLDRKRAKETVKQADLKALDEALRDDPSSVTIVFCDSPDDDAPAPVSSGEAAS